MDIFDAKSLHPEMQHKLMKLSSPVDMVKPGVAKHKWYDLDGLKDTKSTKEFSDLYDAAVMLIDNDSFFRAFITDYDLPTKEVIDGGLHQIVYLTNKIKHEFPGNEWNFVVMVYTILRYCDMVVNHSDSEIAKEIPEFRRQYGLRKSNVGEAMLFYERTEKLLKAHKPIWFRYTEFGKLHKIAVPFKGEATHLIYEEPDFCDSIDAGTNQ